MLGTAGVLRFCLQMQVAISAILLALAFAGQGFVLGLLQMPGGLLDAASGTGESTARAAILHTAYLATAAMVLAKWDNLPRWLAAIHLGMAVLTMPFAVALAAWIWHEARLPATLQDAAGLGGRIRAQLGLAWLGQSIVLSIIAPIAIIAVLAGTAWVGLGLAIVAVALQYLALRLMVRWEPKTKLGTYASPFPQLPDNP